MKHAKYIASAILGLAVLAPSVVAAQAAGLQLTPRLLSGTSARSPFQRKPSRIIYSGDGAALLAGPRRLSSALTWTSWTRTDARASGADWHDNCKPDCAGGTYFAYPAIVHVYRPEHVAGDLLFTRMTVTYTGTQPPHPPNGHGSVTYSLHYSAGPSSFFWQ